MRRCLVSLLLIAGLVASPLAATPHAHAGMSGPEQQRHDATPHFHSQDHSDHHHGGNQSEHHHEDAEQQQDEGSSKLISDSGRFDGPDHDANAIFIGAPSIAISVISKIEQKEPQSPIAPSAILEETRIALWPPLRHEPPWQTPDALQDNSGIFLKLRNLRI